ncbi:MAG: CoA-binding protein [Acidobacteriota bacterium]
MKTVAIVGASANRSKFGNKAVRAFVHRGYHVVPINPREAQVEGLTAYPSVLGVPGPVDLVSLYVPPAVGLRVLDEIAQKGVPEVWINPGAESADLLGRARALALKTKVACSILSIGESPSAY